MCKASTLPLQHEHRRAFRRRDSGGTSLSVPLDLRDVDGGLHRGVVATRALYRKGMDVSTPAARRAALFGWVARPCHG